MTVEEFRNSIAGIAGCCARVASGHAASPLSSVMKSRRLMLDMALPGQECRSLAQSIRTLSLPQRATTF
jgi:hypothetical protein